MPVTIYVRSADENAPAEACPSLTFDGARVVIGRGQSCEVRLPDASVSHRHATLSVSAGSVTVSDEGSRNGTYVGARKLAPRVPYTLRSGELLRVGRVWLEVRVDQRPATRDLSIATKDLALALVSRAMRALGDEASPIVRVEDGPDAGASLVLAEEGRVYRVGRGETCELPLADVDASREHVQIVRRGSVVLVRDRESKNGALLEGTEVPQDRDATWRGGQRLELARTLLVLEEPATAALKSIEDAPDEPLLQADVPPPPPSAAEIAAREAPPPSAPPPAPVSVAPPPSVRAERAPRKRLALADIGLITSALVILVLSLLGLFWLLRT